VDVNRRIKRRHTSPSRTRPTCSWIGTDATGPHRHDQQKGGACAPVYGHELRLALSGVAANAW